MSIEKGCRHDSAGSLKISLRNQPPLMDMWAAFSFDQLLATIMIASNTIIKVMINSMLPPPLVNQGAESATRPSGILPI